MTQLNFIKLIVLVLVNLQAGNSSHKSTHSIQPSKSKAAEYRTDTLTDFIHNYSAFEQNGLWGKGMLFDSKTNLPICYAQISSSDKTSYTMSNTDGEFQFSILKFPLTLYIRKFGYEQKTILVNSPEDNIRISLEPVEFQNKFESNNIKLLRNALDKLRLNSTTSVPDPFRRNLVYCCISSSVDSVTNSFFESYAQMNIPRYSLRGYKPEIARYAQSDKLARGISPNRMEYSIDHLVNYSPYMDLVKYEKKMGFFEQEGQRIVMIRLRIRESDIDYYLNVADTSVVYIKSTREQSKKSKLPGPVKIWKDDMIFSTEISFSPFNYETKNYQTDFVVNNETFRLTSKNQPAQTVSTSTLFAFIPDSSMIPGAVKDYVFNESLEGPKQQISYGTTYAMSKRLSLFESETQKLLSKSYKPAFWQQNALIKPNSVVLNQIKNWEKENRFYSDNRLPSANQIAFDSLIMKLNRNSVYVENVYLETDRSEYIAGDTIWFSAFIPGNRLMDSTSMSRILYVDLINSSNRLQNHLKLQINNGRAYGDFELSNELKNGVFRIRAYTQWMRNFQKDYFFEKKLPVYQSNLKNLIAVNPVINKSNIGDSVNLYLQLLLPPSNKILEKLLDVNIKLNDSISVNRSFRFKDDFRASMGFFVPDSISCSFADMKLTLSDTSLISEQRLSIPVNAGLNIEFFPESGKMVAGIETVIAYKAVDNKGNPSGFHADLFDTNLNLINHITGNNSGVGKFSFTPKSDQTYKAVTTISGKKYSFNLPLTEPKGYVFNYNANSSMLYLKNNLNIKETTHYITASVRGTIFSAFEVKFDTSTVMIRLPFKSYPKGIVQVTLLDSLYRPLAERLIFNNHPEKKILINVETDKEVYAQREKVNLTITVTDFEGNPADASLSMSVLDGTKTDTLSFFSDIESYLYLTSELKGEIDYSLINLSDTSPEGYKNIDLIMMTHGWRNFLWNSIRFSNTMNEIYPVEKGFYIDGHISGYNQGKAGSDYRLNIFDAGTGFNKVINVDEKNSFKFDIPFFYNSHLFVIQNRINKNRIDDIRFSLDTLQVPEIIFQNNELPYFSYKPGYLKTINERIVESDSAYDPNVKYIMIPEVIVRARSRPYYSKPYKTINLDNVDPLGKKYSSIMQMIRGEFGEKAFSKERNGSPVNPVLILDGMMVHLEDPFYGLVLKTPVNEISDVKFYEAGSEISLFYSYRGVPPPYPKSIGWSPHSDQSVVSMTTYLRNGRNYYRGAPKGAIYIPYQGFYQAKEFYHPDYELKKTELPDKRTTIYWNPDINTDSTGRANISFYNSDLKGKALIRISGVSYSLKDASSSVSKYISY